MIASSNFKPGKTITCPARSILPVFALLSAFIQPVGAEVYEQNFSSGGDSLDSVEWVALAGIASGDSVITDLSAETVAVGVSDSSGGYAFFAPKGNPSSGNLTNEPALYYTAATPEAEIGTFTRVAFDWIGDNTDAELRVAVRLGGQWFASQQVFDDPRSNPGSSAAYLTESFEPADFSTANEWRILTSASAGSPGPITLGAAPSSDLAGNVEAMGVLLTAGVSPEAEGDHVRLGRFRVEQGETDPPIPDPRPNVLFITIDDLNDVPGFMGSNGDAITPHMDALAGKGTVFRRAYCTYPLCGPSRASFMSGLMPTTLGFQDHMTNSELKNRTDSLGATLLHEYFGQQGYKTMSCGKIYHAGQPPGAIDRTGGTASFGAKQGLNYSSGGTSTDWGVPANIDEDSDLSDHENAGWAVARLQENHTSPFLLMVGFVQPHVPWYAPQPWFDLYDPDSLTLPPYLPDDFDDISQEAENLSLQPQYPKTVDMVAQGQRKNIQQAYLACVSFTDHYLGQVLDALENSPYADNTIVVVFSDHGYHLGEKNTYQKETLWERSGHVPLIFAGPGIGAQQMSGRVVSLLDIYPTLVDLCGFPENQILEGESLCPLLENPDAGWTRPAVTSFLGNNHAVQTERYRYLLWNDGTEELYDHENDPDEHVNIAPEPGMDAVRTELRKALPTNLKSTGFRMRFEPNHGSPADYLGQMFDRNEISIYDRNVVDTETVVEGMKLAATTGASDLTLELVPAGGFGQWRTTEFSLRQQRDPGLSGSRGHADGDSLPNGIEYVLGTNPKSHESPLSMTGKIFSFPTVVPFPPDVSLTVESTDDFERWEDVVTRLPGETWSGPVTEIPDGDRTRVSLPPSSDPRRFYRLGVTTP